MMLAVERHRRIVEAVNERRSLRVAELARMFDVAEETIRRDLEKLDLEGKLVRSHGGAARREDPEGEVPYARRETLRVAEKTAIAGEALSRIREDDTIMMDPSSTSCRLARQIPDMPLTVVTNSVPVTMELSGRPRVRVISTGGALSTASLSFVGPLAERGLEECRAGKFFFSCKGFSAEAGLSEPDELQAALKRKMFDRSTHRCLLLDSSKFSRVSLHRWARAGEVTEMITDSGAPPDQVDALRRAGLRVTVVPLPPTE